MLKFVAFLIKIDKKKVSYNFICKILEGSSMLSFSTTKAWFVKHI